MRPKKRVLLIDSNEYEASVTAFVLTQWGYRVLRAKSITEARRIKEPDVVLAYFPIDAIKAQSAADAAHVPLIFVCKKHGAGEPPIDGVALVDPPTWELLDRLRVKCIATRGPKPKYHLSIAPQPAEMEVALL